MDIKNDNKYWLWSDRKLINRITDLESKLIAIHGMLKHRRDEYKKLLHYGDCDQDICNTYILAYKDVLKETKKIIRENNNG